MCCNGVLFHRVRLQPNDSPRALLALGLKLKYKKKQHSILQPCPAHRECQCAIYAERPERCRAFACRQLLQLERGEITESAALEKIGEAQKWVARVRELFLPSGSSNPKRSFITRYEAILEQPVEDAWDPAAVTSRRQLIEAFAELEKILTAHFRIKTVREDVSSPDHRPDLQPS